MEYSSMRRSHKLPGILSRSHTDDENHSVFDFSLDDCVDRDNTDDRRQLGRFEKTKKTKKTKKMKAAELPAPSPTNHPYPSIIAVQSTNNNNNNNDKDDCDDDICREAGSPSNSRRRRGSGGGEFRSPLTSPGQRGGGGGGGRRCRSRSESRQPNSPAAVEDRWSSLSSELARLHRDGLRHFNSNRLSEAVESYSRALRVGLEELTHRGEMVKRMTNADGAPPEKDGTILALASSVSRVHSDLGKTLEIAQRYSDAKREYEAGLDILRHTCHATEADGRVKELRANTARMTRAMLVEDERVKQARLLADAYRRIDRSSNDDNPVDKDNARRALIASLERSMRIERDALGEGSYGHAKLRLKLAKARCEGGDVEGGAHDAECAAKTIRSVLGSSHAIVGAASLFVAAVYEKRATTMHDRIKSKFWGEEVQLTPECKSMIAKALEWYADALGPMKFKYDRDDRDVVDDDDECNYSTTVIQPDVGDTFYKIAKLYTKRGGYASAVDACHRALEAYGVTDIDPIDAITTTTKTRDSLYHNFHPDAAFVWHDLASLHLKTKAYNNAVCAAERAVESSRHVLKSSHCGKSIEELPSLAFQIAGDGYVGLQRYEDATRSYQEAYSEFRRIASGGKVGDKGNTNGRVDGATILRKLGMTFYHRGKLDEAKAHLIDALRTERLSKAHCDETGAANSLPLLLSDIGMIHIKCEEYVEAMKALRSCLKLFADRGVPEHSAEVKRARRLFKEAQRRPMEQGATISPHKQNVASSITMDTPQSNKTSSTMQSTLTMPSTNYSQTSSGAGTSRSGQGQLQTLLEELAVGGHDGEEVVSPLHCVYHGKSLFQSNIPSELNSSSKFENSSLEEGNSCEVQRLKRQVEDLKASKVELSQEVECLILRIEEVEKERDQEKKDRVFAAVAHQKEMEAFTQGNETHAVMLAELESLRKVVDVSETSYKELVAAIDNEKEKISNAHISKVQQLQDEIQQLRDKSHHTGSIESSMQSEEATRDEIAMLKEQCQKASGEVSSLMEINRKLQSEKNAAAIDISGLKSKNDNLQSEIKNISSQLEAAKLHFSNNISERNTKIKNLEFELQTERNRRVILESSLQKEYDRPPPAPTCIPFGYPPMQMPMQMYAPDNSSASRLKILEIDLATERANKESLQNVIQELRSTHQQERSIMQQDISDLHRTREQEISDLCRTRAEVDHLNQELRNVQYANDDLSLRLDNTMKELSDTISELSDVKNRMLQISSELSSTIDEKSEEKKKLSIAATDLLSTKEILHKIKEEVKNDKDSLRRKEADVKYWSSENVRLKKEYSEAIAMFEEEMGRAKEDNEKIQSALGNEVQRLNNEVQRLQSDLSTAKHHMQNMLVELEAAHADAKHSTVALASARADIRTKEEQLNQARIEMSQAQQEINELLNNYEELTVSVCWLKESVSANATAHNGHETLGKLGAGDTAIENIKEIVSNLKAEKNDLTERLLSLEELNKNKESVLSSVLRQLESVLPDFYSTTAITEEAPDDEGSNPTMESLENRTSHLLQQICTHINDLTERLHSLEELNKNKESVLSSVLRQLKSVQPDFYSTTAITEEAPDDEGPNPTMESLESHTPHLLQQICTHINQLKGANQLKESTLEKTQWKLSNTIEDLDKIEYKYKALKKEMKGIRDLEQDYNELLDQYNLLVQDKETLENHLKAVHLEKDLFESRLKEAVDDLEELEGERNALKVEHDRAQADSARKDSRIRALEIDNQLIEALEKQAIEYDAALFQKDMKIDDLEAKLDSFRSKLETLDQAGQYDADLLQEDTRLETLERGSPSVQSEPNKILEQPSTDRRNAPIFPNIPTLDQKDTARMEWFAANVYIQDHSETNPFADDSPTSSEVGDEKPTTNPFDTVSLGEERDDYQGDAINTRGNDESMRNTHNAIVSSLQRDGQELMLNEAGDEFPILEISTTQVAGLREGVNIVATIHDNNSEAVSYLQNNALEKSKEVHNEELNCWNERLHELQNIYKQSMTIINAASGSDDAFASSRSLQEEGASLNDIFFQIDEIAGLPSAIAEFSSRNKREIILLQNEIQALKGCSEKLSAQLARSNAYAIESAKAHENDMMNQEKIHQAARENDLALIESLQTAIREKEILLRDKMRQALRDRDELHQNEIGILKSQLIELEESNKALNLELIEMSGQSSISVPDDRENNTINHSIELASINAEFHNAMIMMDELSKENQMLKRDIELLSSKETLEDRNFEKEMNAAHARFESMEKALQQRVSRLEREKDKLVADFNVERTNIEDEHAKTRIELCAWKLEMQNALNEIESLKKERDELNAQVEAYGKSLEAVCMEKAELDQKIYYLGIAQK